MILREIQSVHCILSLLMGALLHRRPAFVRNMELFETFLGHKVSLTAWENWVPKFLVDADLLCSKILMAAALLRGITDVPWVVNVLPKLNEVRSTDMIFW